MAYAGKDVLMATILWFLFFAGWGAFLTWWVMKEAIEDEHWWSNYWEGRARKLEEVLDNKRENDAEV